MFNAIYQFVLRSLRRLPGLLDALFTGIALFFVATWLAFPLVLSLWLDPNSVAIATGLLAPGLYVVYLAYRLDARLEDINRF